MARIRHRDLGGRSYLSRAAALAVMLSADALTAAEGAERVDTHRQVVDRWLREWHEAGLVRTAGWGGANGRAIRWQWADSARVPQAVRSAVAAAVAPW